MNPTHILTDIKNNNGTIYLVSNRTHGYSTILPLAEANFIPFLEELYTIIEVDDYDIRHKYLSEANLKNKIINYLHTIFKSDTLTFTIDNTTVCKDVPYTDVDAVSTIFEIIDVTTVTQNSAVANNTSNDFFIYLNQLLVNHILNDELLKKFKLLEQEKPIMKNNDAKQKNTICDILKSSKSPDNIIKVNTVEKETVKDKRTILPYNYYESLENNIEDTVYNVLPYESDTTFTSTLQYSSWKADELNTNFVCEDNCNKCTILYCVSQSMGIVIENQNTIFVEYLTKNFKDFELVKAYSQLNIKELDNIKNYFHKRDFESNEIILKKINSFEFLFDINNDVNDNEIEKFIRERYTIDNEPKNMMKANEILGQLMIELQYLNKDKMKLTKELSSILLSMGLKKKRMADGIYYYGIVSKQNLFLSSVVNIEEMYKKTVEEHKLESSSEILTRLKSSCKNRSGPCNCLDIKGCDRVVVPKLHESFAQPLPNQ